MELFRGKLFGHPIHMMLVHFPSALLPVAAGADALMQSGLIGPFALRPILLCGVAFGWLAALFGFWDLTRIKTGTRAMTVALTHGGMNVAALCGFSWALYQINGPHPGMRLTVELISACVILVGSKFGGDLVVRYFIGTNFEKPFDT